jgi:hypothetical protein
LRRRMIGNKSITERLKIDIKKIVLGRREHACRGLALVIKEWLQKELM